MDAKELTNVGREIASADSANGTGSYAPDVGETAADASGHAEGEEEIEVTEEMIRVGADELALSFSLDGHLDDPRDVVTDIFKAMTRASKAARYALSVV
jgi:hypothetical protein